MAFGLIMRNIGLMRPGALWRAAGRVLLAAVFMPAPVWAGDYTLAWRDGAWVERQADDSLAYEPPEVTVNGVALSAFAHMQRIEEVQVSQHQAETLHVFQVWQGGMSNNYQLMLVRLADAGVEVIGPTQEQFEDIEIIPTRILLDDSGKDRPGYLFKLYNENLNDGEPVAVYRYMGGNGWYSMDLLSGSGFGELYENYTATREARIAEAIAAALAYDGLDPKARRILAGVIKPDGAMGQCSVLDASFPHDIGTDRIRLTIGESKDEDGDWGWHTVWLVEIRLWRSHRITAPYAIESVTLSLLAG